MGPREGFCPYPHSCSGCPCPLRLAQAMPRMDHPKESRGNGHLPPTDARERRSGLAGARPSRRENRADRPYGFPAEYAIFCKTKPITPRHRSPRWTNVPGRARQMSWRTATCPARRLSPEGGTTTAYTGGQGPPNVRMLPAARLKRTRRASSGSRRRSGRGCLRCRRRWRPRAPRGRRAGCPEGSPACSGRGGPGGACGSAPGHP